MSTKPYSDTLQSKLQYNLNDVIVIQKNGTTTLDGMEKTTIGNLISGYGIALASEAGYTLNLSMDPSTYVLTPKLYDKDGTLISTGQSVDLPLETMVVSGSYDSANKKIVLTLKNGTTIDIPVADLISGLVSTTTFNGHANNNEIHVSAEEKAGWDGKYDLPDGGIPKSDLESAVKTSLEKADAAQPKETGKGLSTNDYSDAEKQKVTDAYADKHSHGNKTALDNVSQAVIDKANSAVQPSGLANYVSVNVQSFTEEQKQQARNNIGAGTGGGVDLGLSVVDGKLCVTYTK